MLGLVWLLYHVVVAVRSCGKVIHEYMRHEDPTATAVLDSVISITGITLASAGAFTYAMISILDAKSLKCFTRTLWSVPWRRRAMVIGSILAIALLICATVLNVFKSVEFILGFGNTPTPNFANTQTKIVQLYGYPLVVDPFQHPTYLQWII